VAAEANKIFHARPPHMEITSAVGSGDSMVAGMAYAMAQELAFEEIVRYGVAAGTANALAIGAGVFARADFERILRATIVTEANE
jgi:fructose-1-phosphate kinase PfkB-like protein